jgi:hypothetical protein
MSKRLVGNLLACKHGYLAEQIAIERYNCEIKVNALIDAEYQNKPLEVKSCSVWVTDNHAAKYRRRGRYTLTKEQHDVLLANDGYYFFVVFDGIDIPVLSKIVRARLIPAIEGESSQLVWTKIFRELE